MTTAALGLVCGLLGLVIGSFVTIVIERVPDHASVFRLRSHCLSCDAPLAPRDLVPVASWIRQRARCRSCGERISIRYPLVEAGTAALFAAAAVRFGADWALPAYLVLFASLLAVSAIDLERYIIPNRIVYPTIALAVPLLALAALAEGDGDRLWHALAGGALAFGLLLAVHLVTPRGMGFGDVRLAFILGLFLGWLDPWLSHVFLGLFLGFLLGSIIGVVLVVLGRRHRQQQIPFGPFLACGTVIAVLFGHSLLHWYRR